VNENKVQSRPKAAVQAVKYSANCQRPFVQLIILADAVCWNSGLWSILDSAYSSAVGN